MRELAENMLQISLIREFNNRSFAFSNAKLM